MNNNKTTLNCMLIGSGSLLIECAHILRERRHGIHLIASDDADVANWAGSKGIPCLSCREDFLSVAKQQPLDCLFSIVNYNVLPEELLKLPRLGAINYHDAPLPRYAGLHATTWALISGEKSHAISWHKMEKLVDGGDIYKQRQIEISANETAMSLNGRCYSAAIDAFRELIEELARGSVQTTPQDLSDRTYFSKYHRPTAACVVNWNRTAKEIEALVRALDFGTYPNPIGLVKLIYGDQVFLVGKAKALASTSKALPGTITHICDESMRVAAAIGEVEIGRLLSVDGQEIDISEFGRRSHVCVGTCLPTLSEESVRGLTEANDRVCRHEEFWVERLSRLVPLSLPLNQMSGADCNGTAQSPASITIGEEGLHGSANLPYLPIAAFGAFLARISGNHLFDIGFRLGDKGLGGSEFEPFFSSHVPLRFEVDLTKGIESLVQEMQKQIESLWRHQSYPRDVVPRYPQLRGKAVLSREQKLPITVEILDSSSRSKQIASGIELSLQITECSGGCAWSYDASRFDAETVQRLAKCFTGFLESLVRSPGVPIQSVPLLTTEEKNSILLEWNRAETSCSIDSCIHQLFEEQVARTPEAVALTCEGQSLTYRQLNARSNRLARELRVLGAGPDVLVGISMERSNELVIGLLAILKAGGAYLPIDLAYPPERLAFMLADANASVLLTQSKLVKGLPTTSARVVCIDEMLRQATTPRDEVNLATASGPDNLAYVIYTSGTTGKPKGSMITHRNVTRLFSATDHWYHFHERDVWTLFHSCAFDFSVWEIWGALFYGGRVVVVPYLVSRSPQAFYQLLAQEKVTVLNQTPSAFRQLVQAEGSVEQKELSLRYVIFGGEALEMQSLRPWFERHGDQKPRLVNMYGITETTVHVTYRPLSRDDVQSGSVIGVPIPDLQVYILDAQRQPLPVGVPGEMYVGGAGLARGYLNCTELTAERFIPDHITGKPGARLYKTGDLARFLPGRDIEYLGRIDSQVKIRGFRIELGEIESVLCQHPAVVEAVVLAREDSPGDKRLVAFMVAAGMIPQIAELREYLKRQIPEYMVPAAYVFLEKIPLTVNGKVDRKALPDSPTDSADLGSEYVAPRTETEREISRIWQRLLKIERISVQDDFFDLGGHSITVLQAISVINNRFHSDIPPGEMFEHRTIAALAALLEANAKRNLELVCPSA